MKRILLLAFALLLGGAVNGAMAQEYHAGDVAVVNAIITGNGLQGYAADAPDDWDFATWNDDSPKRISELGIYMRDLTGALDVSGLAGLIRLECDDNQLTALDVSGLAGLTRLDCHVNQLTELNLSGLAGLTNLNCDKNQLTELDVSALTGLKELACNENQLTELDVSALTSLMGLYCGGNRLTELDMSGLAGLMWLNCPGNPLTTLILPNGKTVAISASPAEGGSATIDYFNPSENEIALLAKANTDYTFTGWTAIPSVTFDDAAAAETGFTMPDTDVAVTGNFVSEAVEPEPEPEPEPGPALSVSPTWFDLAADGEQKTFAILCNTDWIVSSDKSWLTVSPASGRNDGTVTITAEANAATRTRTATITVNATGVTTMQTITVTQAAFEEVPPPPALVLEETQTVDAKGHGKIKLRHFFSTTATLTGAFEMHLPTGIALDEELTALSTELAGDFVLSLTAKANNTWLIEIKPKGLRALQSVSEYSNIMNIAYTAGTEVQQGVYEARITNLNFLLSTGRRIEEGLLTAPIHVTQTITSVESVCSTPFTARFAGDMLRVESNHAERISIYSFAGVLLYAADKPEGMIEIPLPSNPGTVCIVKGSRSGVVKVVK